jgi:import inner membrane translocase subunit TIM21
MFLTFFVSSSANAPKPASENYLERVQEQFSELSEMSWDDVASTTRTKAEGAWESVQAGVRYLVGKPASLIAPTPSHEAEVAKQEAEKGAWSFVGLFSSLRGSKQDGNGTSAALDEQFTEGEVHAELIRVST